VSNNFWAARLGQQPAQQPQQPAPAPASNRPWWEPPVTPQQPSAPAPVAPQQPVQQAPVPQNQERHLADLLTQPEYSSTKARSAQDAEFCPSCGSGNYLHIGGLLNRPKRCFECGFNPMFEHSTAGASGIGQNLPQHSARAQNIAPAGAPPMGSVVDRV
jgi:hypothetical protein